MTPRPAPRLLDDGAAVAIVLGGETRRFHAIWLRDNGLDPETRDAGTGQRLVTLRDLAADPRILAAAWDGDDRLWLDFSPDGKRLAFARSWLIDHAYDRPPPRSQSHSQPPGLIGAGIAPWDATAAACLPAWDFSQVSDRAAVRRDWLAQIRRHGFALLRGARAAPGTAEAVTALFGHVRETNYGRTFDVRVAAAPTNLAYTDLGLQPHTDNPYRDPPPGLQILACLRNAASGGETVLVDGFALCERLRATDPGGFALLARYNARFAYAGAAGVRLAARRPIVALAPDGELLGIRFNNRSAAPFVDVPYAVMADYYAAYRGFAALVDAPALRFAFRMAPGDVLVFDNLRILHGRTAFGGGERWLEGCYADRDGLLSTLAFLEEELRRWLT